MVSICSDRPYKHEILTMSEEEYFNATFSYEEMFPDAEANALWNVTASRSYLMGRCYSHERMNPTKAGRRNDSGQDEQNTHTKQVRQLVVLAEDEKVLQYLPSFLRR